MIIRLIFALPPGALLRQHPGHVSAEAGKTGPAHLASITLRVVVSPRVLPVPLPQAGELHQHVPPGGQRHHVRGRPGRGLRAGLQQQRSPRPPGAVPPQV